MPRSPWSRRRELALAVPASLAIASVMAPDSAGAAGPPTVQSDGPPPGRPASPPGASTTAQDNPFLPTGPGGRRTTPPPPPTTTAGGPDGGVPAAEPDAPPQDLSETWGYSRRNPAQPRYVRTGDPNMPAAPNPIGFYSGVSVRGNHVPPSPPPSFGGTPALMSWAGFERAPEGSRVFFQLNGEVDHAVSSEGLVIEVRMRNTRVNVRNNTRKLDLRYFKTPVRSVDVRRRGRDTVARIVLKREASPQVQLVDGKAGYKLLVVQFDDPVEPDRVSPAERIEAPPATVDASGD